MDEITVVNNDTGETISIPRDQYESAVGPAFDPFEQPIDESSYPSMLEEETIPTPQQEPSFFGGMMKTYGAIPSGIGYLGNKISEAQKDPVLAGMPMGLGTLAGTAGGVLSDMGIGGVARAATEGAVMGGTSLIPGVGPALAPGAGALTSLGIDALSGNADFSEANLKERMGEYYALPVGATLARSGLGLLGSAATKLAPNTIGKGRVKAAQRFAKTGEADVKALGINTSKAARQQALIAEVKEAAPKVGATDLWEGGDVFDPNTMKFVKSRPDVPVTAEAISGNLETGIKTVKTAIDDTVSELDTLSRSKEGVVLGLTKADELPIAEIKQIAESRDKWFGTKESAATYKELLAEAKKSFGAKSSSILEDKGIPDGVGIKDMHDILRNVYAEQRALKQFDATMEAGGAVNPSILAKNATTRDFLNKIAGRLREKLAEKSAEIVSGTSAKMSPTKLSDLNEVMSSLLPMKEFGLDPALKSIGVDLTKADAFTPELNVGTIVRKGYEKTTDLVYPDASKWAGQSDAIIKGLQTAERTRRSIGAPSNLTTPTTVKLGRTAAMIGEAILSPSPALVGTEALQAIKNSKSYPKLEAGLKSTPENATRAVSEFMEEEPELAEQFFSEPKYKGYNVVTGEDGADYLYDPNQVLAFAEKIKREEPSIIVQAKRRLELNKSNKIVSGETVQLPKQSDNKVSSVKTLGGSRQETDY
jgi:hypothetical protein